MKRTSEALVAYSSSEEESHSNIPVRKKKLFVPSYFWHAAQHTHGRKLPSLASTLVVPVPVDDPALHQGRIRATPHVDGQYTAHVYIPLVLHPKTALYSLLEEVLDVTKEMVPAVHAIGQSPSCSRNNGGTVVNGSHRARQLHLSLSRPIFLRAHQREEFNQAIGLIASRQAPCAACHCHCMSRDH